MKNAFVIALLFAASPVISQTGRINNYQMILSDDWRMQSSLSEHASGKQISGSDFNTKSWYPVHVPTTIIGGLLENKLYTFDPFYGKNLEKLADTTMDHTWWFRKSFRLPASEDGKNIVLTLHGINYKANLWLNGSLIADSAYIKGPFRMIEVDITNRIKKDGDNVIALEILRPFNPNRKNGDLAIDYADWIHYPPDYNGGIINNITINTYNKIGVKYPLVTTKFDLPSLAVAHLEVTAEVVNYSDNAEEAIVKGRINGDITFQQEVHLSPKEKKQITFTSSDYPQLNISNPRVWWPWQYGQQEMNRIEFSVIKDGKTSNTIAEDFGIRQIESELINDHSRKFIVNGKPIMLRGAAWSPDIFQRRSEERQEQEIRLVRDMGMNIIRSEGKLEDDHFYDLCDKYGLLVMTGWMCCGAWQYPENWDADERWIAMSSDSSVMHWLRNKASIMVWLNGSDMPPRDTTVERDWLAIEAGLKWPNPIISTADESKSKVSGFSGVKMNGPYDWVPPIYWESDSTRLGGAWGFATEISPGPSIPPYESLIRFIPKDSLWHTNSDWLYHCGTMNFGNTKRFDSALEGRYGPSATINEYLKKAQAQNYEGHRAMMEAYGLLKYNTATGVVQWMLSNPWPSLIWHTYDYYLYPAGTYFGMKKSMEPLHVMYSYKTREVAIINSLLKDFPRLQVKASVYNLDGSLKYSNTVSTGVATDGIQKCFAIPAIEGLSDTYFIRLEMNDEDGKNQSINWYWLSKKKDELDWKKSKWYYTPQSAFADFSALQKLPQTTLDVTYTTSKNSDSTIQQITITNKGGSVAFFVHLRGLKGKNGEDILPVIFDDNYLSLAPGEKRVISCRYENKDAGSGDFYLSVDGWNIDEANSKAEQLTADN